MRRVSVPKGERRALLGDGSGIRNAEVFEAESRSVRPSAAADTAAANWARPGERRTGIATFSDPASGQQRTYVCDPSHHRVHIVGPDGRPIASVGQQGSRPGEFDTPVDVTLVRVPFAGEDLEDGDLEGRLVAVADQGNDRIQLFEPDGVPFGVISGRLDSASDIRRRSGHRIFRIDAHPYLIAPSRLSTNGSVLEVHCAGGRTVLVDLTHALLLDFVMWADSPAAAAQKVSAWLL